MKSVWRRLRKPSRVTLDAIGLENAVCTKASFEWHAEAPSNPIQMTFGSTRPWAEFAPNRLSYFPRATAIAGRLI